jgi:hypothetical protein
MVCRRLGPRWRLRRCWRSCVLRGPHNLQRSPPRHPAKATGTAGRLRGGDDGSILTNPGREASNGKDLPGLRKDDGKVDDAEGERDWERWRRHGDDPPALAFEDQRTLSGSSLRHIGGLIPGGRLRRRWRPYVRKAPVTSTHRAPRHRSVETPSDALRHPAQATGTAGRLRSGDILAILSDLGRHRSQLRDPDR